MPLFALLFLFCVLLPQAALAANEVILNNAMGNKKVIIVQPGAKGSTDLVIIKQPEVRTLCPYEAARCPDGSRVVRIPPQCDFAPCPKSITGTIPAQPCLRDARRCPDGSSVSRIGPNCEFAPCPGETPPTTIPAPLPPRCTTEAAMCPDGSFVGRTGPNCEFAPCPH